MAKETQTTPSLTVTGQPTAQAAVWEPPNIGRRVLIGYSSCLPLPGPAPSMTLDKNSGGGTGPTAFHPLRRPTRCVTPRPVSRQRKTHSAAVLLSPAVNAQRLHGRMKLTTTSRQSWKSKSESQCNEILNLIEFQWFFFFWWIASFVCWLFLCVNQIWLRF